MNRGVSLKVALALVVAAFIVGAIYAHESGLPEQPSTEVPAGEIGSGLPLSSTPVPPPAPAPQPPPAGGR